MILDSLSLAFALAMDAFAVSVSSGISLDHVGKREVFRVSWHFALFQFLFFASGFLFGSEVSGFMTDFADWAASLILFFIGAHMIYESLQKEDDKIEVDPTKGKRLIFLSVATSIDAMAAGFGFSMVESKFAFASACVFFVTLIMCVIGILSGSRLSNADLLKGFSESLGGLILILLALKIFIDL